MFSNVRSSFFGLRYSTLTVIAATIVALIVLYLVLRFVRGRNRSKYGFRISPTGQADRPQSDAAQPTREAFIAENDAAIGDVLADYVGAHPEWQKASSEEGRWAIEPKSGRKGAQDDCFVRCCTVPSYEDGRPVTTVEIHLPDQLRDRKVLGKALEKVVRKSKSGRKVALNFSHLR